MLLIAVIDKLFLIYTLMIFARILISWFPEYQDHSVVRFLRAYTDPYLNFFKQFIPPLGMFDLSPIVAIFSLQILESLVNYLLYTLLK